MGVITDATGQFKVGIDPGTTTRPGGSIVDFVIGMPSGYVGFQRIADAWDVLREGSPREGYGLTSDTDVGWVDQYVAFPGFSGLSPLTPFVFSGTSATGSVAIAGILQVDLTYEFFAPNILRIGHRVTNLTSIPRRIHYRRVADWDCDGLGLFVEDTAFFPSVSLPILSRSRIVGGSSEQANPTTAFTYLVPGSGASYTIGDYGIGLTLDVGIVAAGGSKVFNVYYGISSLGQSEALLRAQMPGILIGSMAWTADNNKAIAVSASFSCCPCATPGMTCCLSCGDGQGTPLTFRVNISGFGAGCEHLNGIKDFTYIDGFTCDWRYASPDGLSDLFLTIDSLAHQQQVYLDMEGVGYFTTARPWIPCGEPIVLVRDGATGTGACASVPATITLTPILPTISTPVCAECCGEVNWPDTIYATITNISGAACLDGLVLTLTRDFTYTDRTIFYTATIQGLGLCCTDCYVYFNFNCADTTIADCRTLAGPGLELVCWPMFLACLGPSAGPASPTQCTISNLIATETEHPTIVNCNPFHVRYDNVPLIDATGGSSAFCISRCVPAGSLIRIDLTW